METLMDKIVSLCKRRGFVYPGSEIYGGLANTWDYGPYGVLLKNNIKQQWWKTFVQEREDMVGLDAAILMNPRTWEASGHVASFSDPLVDCKKCKERFRGDKIIEEIYKKEINLAFEDYLKELGAATYDFIKEVGVETVGKMVQAFRDQAKKSPQGKVDVMLKNDIKLKCPNCGAFQWTEAKSFNLMFKTHQGVIEGEGNEVYLRPETAQGIFVNFKNVVDTCRVKVPFGIAQIGKAFRNEITPGNFTFRTREFEQMEIEFFIKPGSENEYFDTWCNGAMQWFTSLGMKEESLRFREHDKDELSHYSTMTKDIEFKFPFGKAQKKDKNADAEVALETWGELAGIAYRGNYDLTQHIKFSGEKLEYRDPQTNEVFVPHVIEPSFGADRAVLAFLINAYEEETLAADDVRTVMKFHPRIAPIKAAIFPLSKQLNEKAREIFNILKKDFMCEYDESGSIGKRYRRQDEIGTPFCITVDFDTENDQAVTIRNRDSMSQERVAVKDLKGWLEEKLK